ncbi:hypothetical protein PB01_14250 [Psychrobacillus glaciei]|uniref:Uncharacterized protein n=1 Tax=Psychrobacillus glaciei TaxID=2283160 RepID=A0A5J6SPA2_9BACI|nr:hypothetical protein [Psychrobacillus glaciei]QFF99890.1 hypothetical protein PB01_14250 [Psychrobacillus glaciei]
MILQKLTGMESELSLDKTDLSQVKSQLDENTLLTRAIHARQEKSDAKIELLSMDLNKLHGSVNALKREIEFKFKKNPKTNWNPIDFQMETKKR